MSNISCSNEECGGDVEYALCTKCENAADARAEEVVFLRGYNQGYRDGKEANPPPKARDLARQLVKERAAWAEKKRLVREYIAAQSSDSVPVRIAARERLLAALGETP